MQVPDEWMDSVEDDVLTLMKEEGVGALQLSFAQHLYTPDMLPPHLLELAEHIASKSADLPLFDQRLWRRTPEGYENKPVSHTGARSPDDVVVNRGTQSVF